ncbi:YciI family protein [Agrobacterium sp. a22-2]|uniref:YciI-like protein n=1 Tax=Rhizobium/Agrobacterium group TaxID=227290 RepID=UPI00144640B0|nr:MULTISPECIES: YciI-like protein [Rhizobium/Agrobacterium group]MCM2475302.1 YciI family protein [Rhizobium sp. CG5]NKN36966.1 YciI family protein [Agrobacterium sp. a22-2]
MLFAVLCKDKPNHLNLRMETRPPHVEWLNGLNAAGTLKIGGPFLDGDGKPCGSMLLIAADDLDGAKAIAAQDPYALAGLFESVEIKPYNWVFNNPEA